MTLVAGLLILLAVAASQLCPVVRARYPALRAGEALATVLSLFLLLCASACCTPASQTARNRRMGHSENEHGWQVVHCASAAAIFIGWYLPSITPGSQSAGSHERRPGCAL